MKANSQVPDSRNYPRDFKLTAGVGDAEGSDVKTDLPDDELEQVSAAGDALIPTMNPEVMLGRHDIPADAQKRRP